MDVLLFVALVFAALTDSCPIITLVTAREFILSAVCTTRTVPVLLERSGQFIEPIGLAIGLVTLPRTNFTTRDNGSTVSVLRGSVVDDLVVDFALLASVLGVTRHLVHALLLWLGIARTHALFPPFRVRAARLSPVTLTIHGTRWSGARLPIRQSTTRRGIDGVVEIFLQTILATPDIIRPVGFVLECLAVGVLLHAPIRALLTVTVVGTPIGLLHTRGAPDRTTPNLGLRAHSRPLRLDEVVLRGVQNLVSHTLPTLGDPVQYGGHLLRRVLIVVRDHLTRIRGVVFPRPTATRRRAIHGAIPEIAQTRPTSRSWLESLRGRVEDPLLFPGTAPSLQTVQHLASLGIVTRLLHDVLRALAVAIHDLFGGVHRDIFWSRWFRLLFLILGHVGVAERGRSGTGTQRDKSKDESCFIHVLSLIESHIFFTFQCTPSWSSRLG